MSRPPFTFVAVFLLLGLTALAGCKKDEDEATDPNVVTLYSGRSEALVAPLIEKFEESSGMTVKVKYGKSGELAGTILEEGNKSPADVFWSQDAGTLGVLAEKDMLSELSESTLNKVDPTFRSPAENWVATSGRARVLVYNTDKLSAADLPKSVAELTEAKWKGRVGWAPENASFQAFVAAMVELEGEAATKSWLQGMVGNDPKTYPKNTPAVKATGAGEVDLALVNHYYLFRIKKEEGDSFTAENHFLKNGKAGALVNVAGASILSSSKNKAGAQKLIDYLLEKEAQSYFAEETYEYPVSGDVSPYEGLPDLATLNPPSMDLNKLSSLETAIKLLREVDALP